MTSRTPFAKTLPSGGTINPMEPPIGFKSRFEPIGDDEYTDLMAEALRIRGAVASGQTWANHPDSEIGAFMERYSGSAAPSPLFVWMLEDDIAANPQMTLAQVAAGYVRMDDPINLARKIRDYANMMGWEIRAPFRLAETPDADFIGRQIQSVEYMVDGLSMSMIKGFTEKTYWAAQPEGYNRPEEYFDCGACATAYPEGCPAHGERPAGHGIFAGHISARACRYYNGAGVDITIRAACLQLALARVLSFVHHARSCTEGFDAGEEWAFAQ